MTTLMTPDLNLVKPPPPAVSLLTAIVQSYAVTDHADCDNPIFYDDDDDDDGDGVASPGLKKGRDGAAPHLAPNTELLRKSFQRKGKIQRIADCIYMPGD